MQTPKITKIYLDMDGVICDFEKKYKELFQLAPREAERHKQFDVLFKNFISNRQFAKLAPMPGTWSGLAYLQSCGIPVEILSSTAREEYYDEISQQKVEWLENFGINFKTNFVPGKKHKYKFATPDSIIIDDTPSVIEDWNKAGGIGILHRDWNETMAILSLYLAKA